MGFEHLRAYGAATLLRAEVDQLLAGMGAQDRVVGANMIGQVDRAADSILNNIAEANDSAYPRKKANYLDIAVGSCFEVRNGLRSLTRRELLQAEGAAKALSLTHLIPKMLRPMKQRS